MAFNRNRSGGGDRGGFRPRPSFGGRDRGPVEMHDAICDNCGKSCQVPFRPTSGKPIFCSNCFESKREGSPRFAGEAGDRPMFDATCADCGNACKVPFQPSGDKPVFCSNCFGDKKNAGGNGGGGKINLDELNAKLDKILSLLEKPSKPAKKTKEPKAVEEAVEETPLETSD